MKVKKEGFCKALSFIEKMKSESEKRPGQEDLCRALVIILVKVKKDKNMKACAERCY